MAKGFLKFIKLKLPLLLMAAILAFAAAGCSTSGPKEDPDQKAANAFLRAVENLPSVETITLEDTDAVVAVEVAYGRLSEEVRLFNEDVEYARQDLSMRTGRILSLCMGNNERINIFISMIVNVGDVSTSSQPLLGTAFEEYEKLTEDEKLSEGAVNAKKILDAKNTAYAAMLTAGSDDAVAKSFIGMVASIGSITIATLETVNYRIESAETFYSGMTAAQQRYSGVPAAYSELKDKKDTYNSLKQANDNNLAAAAFLNAVNSITLSFESEPEILEVYRMYREELTLYQQTMPEVLNAYRELGILYDRFNNLFPLLRVFLDKVTALEAKEITPTASFYRNIKLLKDEYSVLDAEAREFVRSGYERILTVENTFYSIDGGIRTVESVTYTYYNAVNGVFSATADAVLDVGEEYFSKPYEDLPTMDKAVYVDGVRLVPNGTKYTVKNVLTVTNRPFNLGVITKEVKFVLAAAEFTAEIKIKPPLAPVTAVEVGDSLYHLHDPSDTDGKNFAADFLLPEGAVRDGFFEAQDLPYLQELRKFRVLIYPETVNVSNPINAVPFTSYEISENSAAFGDPNLMTRGGQRATAFFQVNRQRITAALATAGYAGSMRVRVAVQEVSANDNYSDSFIHALSFSSRVLSISVSNRDGGAVKLPTRTDLIGLERKTGQGGNGSWWGGQISGHLQYLRGIRLEGVPAMFHPDFDSIKIYVFGTGESRNQPQFALGYFRIQSVKSEYEFGSPSVQYWSCLKGNSEQPEEKFYENGYTTWENLRFNLWVHYADLKTMVRNRILQKTPGYGSDSQFKFAVQMCAVPGSSFSDSDLSGFTENMKIALNTTIPDGDNFWGDKVTVMPVDYI